MAKIKEWFEKNGKYIKIGIAAAVVLILIWCLVFTPVERRTAEYAYTQELDVKTLQTVGLLIDENGGFKSYTNDPQLWIMLPGDTTFNDISIKLENPLKDKTMAQLFYSTDNSLTEEKSLAKNVNKETEIYYSLEDANYTLLRFDMGGQYKIQSITLSYVTEMKEYTRYVVNIPAFIFIMVLAVIFLVLYFCFKEQSIKTINSVKLNLFSSDPAKKFGDQRKLANLCFYLMIVFGFGIIFFSPPFTCPDEHVHFMNVCKIANGQWFAHMEGGSVGCTILQKEIDFIHTYGNVYNGTYAQKFGYNTMLHLINDTALSYESFLANELATINSISYMVSGSAAAVAKLLVSDISPYSLLIVAKIANLFFAATVLRWAIMKTAAFPNLMFMLALMPMTIFQCASTSYDALLIPCSFLLFAYATKILLSDEDYVINLEDILAICFSCVFLCGTKVAYVPLILILLSISIKKFGSLKRYLTCISLVAGIFAVCYLAPNAVNAVITRGFVSPNAEIIAQQREYYMSNLSLTPVILRDTTDFLFDFWAEGFFGILGGLDTYFPYGFVLFYFVLMAVVAVLDALMVGKVKITTRLTTFISTAVITVASIITMYIEWTPRVVNGGTPGTIAYGIQGRYFIPLALFFVLTFGNSLLNKFKYREKVVCTTESLLKTISPAYLVLTLLVLAARFWFLPA